MVAVVATSRFGPDTYQVSPSGFVDGGMLVEPDPGNPGFIRSASAGSSTFLGVAIQPAEGTAFVNPTTAAYNAPVLDISVPQAAVAVGWQGTYKLTYSEAATFGQLLSCGATGTVIPYQGTAYAGAAPTDVATYGPKSTVNDGALIGGSLTVTSATAAFVATDVYRTISGGSIPAGAYITSVVNGTTVTISAAPNLTASGVSLTFGNSPIITSAASTFTNAVEGATATGGSIPASTVVTQFIDAHTLRLSNAPTAAASGLTVTLGAVAAQTLAAQVVGRCVEPNGVIAGSIGRVRLAGI